MKLLPKLLTEKEAGWWGLTPMIPHFPPEEILFIESKWSKKALQQMAEENFLDPSGDKELLVSKLLFVGALDSQGEVVEKTAEERLKEFAEALPFTDIEDLAWKDTAQEFGFNYERITKVAIPKAEALPERMPRINPHASAIKQDEQLREQMRWLKKHGFKTAREAQEAGY